MLHAQKKKKKTDDLSHGREIVVINPRSTLFRFFLNKKNFFFFLKFCINTETRVPLLFIEIMKILKTYGIHR